MKNQPRNNLCNNLPLNISIIIPVRNEEDSIIDCLNSLLNQNYDVNKFEIIIVDDNSTDNTQRVIKEFTLSNSLNINLISLDGKTSKKEALKLGISNSQYEIIATTDADCVLPKNWLKSLEFQYQNETNMLLGPVMFKKAKGFLSAFQALDFLAIQGIEFGLLNFNLPILNNAANLSYSKESYNNVKGFDNFNTPSGDDVFLLEKFKSNSEKIKGLLSQDFIVETNSETNYSGFINQRLRWSSKTKYYSDKTLITISSIVLIQNVMLLFIYLGLPLVEKYNIVLAILLFSKWLIDFILLFLVASFFKRKSVLVYFIPAQIIYPIYLCVIWILSMVMKFEWKGRKF